ncbi:MAG TPA: RNA 2',3'-cyclic phosphodiesterase [Gemmatimonadales bacterium]|nr:RNA 2',3'-cyclic phosphodiesterase [Gemmatimonadales bacterium]
MSSPGGTEGPDAGALEVSLRQLGLELDVRPAGALAVLVPQNDAGAQLLSDRLVRERVIEAARAAGFTHAAIELFPPGGNAAAKVDTFRLFIALEVDGQVQDRIRRSIMDQLQPRLPDARWVRPENLHITLKFLGNTPASGVTAIQEALLEAAAQVPPFRMVLSRVGAFPALSRPRVVWLGLRGDGKARCEALAAAVNDACATIGFARETRKFAAHLTLARTRKQRAGDSAAAPAEGFADAARRITDAWIIPVTHVSLVRSELSREGSRYSTLARCPLGGGGGAGGE